MKLIFLLQWGVFQPASLPENSSSWTEKDTNLYAINYFTHLPGGTIMCRLCGNTTTMRDTDVSKKLYISAACHIRCWHLKSEEPVLCEGCGRKFDRRTSLKYDTGLKCNVLQKHQAECALFAEFMRVREKPAENDIEKEEENSSDDDDDENDDDGRIAADQTSQADDSDDGYHIVHQPSDDDQSTRSSAPISCEFCRAEFIDFEELYIHKTKHHKTYKGCFQCQLCSMVFLGHAKYTQHVERDHPEVAIKQCPSCGPYPLTDTQRYTCKSCCPVPEQGQCAICYEKCGTDEQCAQHERDTHMKCTSHELACPLCSSRFQHYQAFFDHISGPHKGYRFAECPVCGCVSKNRRIGPEELLCHLRHHYERWACDLCDSTFKEKINLIKHRCNHDDFFFPVSHNIELKISISTVYFIVLALVPAFSTS